MKILLAGPLPNSKKSGGVAIFTENLAKKAVQNKHKVLVVTNQKKSMIKSNGFEITNIWNIHEIKKFNPDVVISSLQYSFILSFYNFINAKKIHIVHGFTNFMHYGWYKFNLMHLIDLIIRKKYDLFLANSIFTRYINENIFNVKCDGVITIGISDDEITQLIKIGNKQLTSRQNNLLYVGRLVEVKNVDLAIRAFLLTGNSKLKFVIDGYGNEYKVLKNKYITEKKIIFNGAIEHSKIIREYLNSKVFISLNESEPFGITYEEAIASGLYVVAPKTGGQVDFLSNFPERCSLVDIHNLKEIEQAIVQGFNSNLSPLSEQEIYSMSYQHTLNSIFKILSKLEGEIS